MTGFTMIPRAEAERLAHEAGQARVAELRRADEAAAANVKTLIRSLEADLAREMEKVDRVFGLLLELESKAAPPAGPQRDQARLAIKHAYPGLRAAVQHYPDAQPPKNGSAAR